MDMKLSLVFVMRVTTVRIIIILQHYIPERLIFTHLVHCFSRTFHYFEKIIVTSISAANANVDQIFHKLC
jgi:hypothetical protein